MNDRNQNAEMVNSGKQKMLGHHDLECFRWKDAHGRFGAG